LPPATAPVGHSPSGWLCDHRAQP